MPPVALCWNLQWDGTKWSQRLIRHRRACHPAISWRSSRASSVLTPPLPYSGLNNPLPFSADSRDAPGLAYDSPPSGKSLPLPPTRKAKFFTQACRYTVRSTRFSRHDDPQGASVAGLSAPRLGGAACHSLASAKGSVWCGFCRHTALPELRHTVLCKS